MKGGEDEPKPVQKRTLWTITARVCSVEQWSGLRRWKLNSVEWIVIQLCGGGTRYFDRGLTWEWLFVVCIERPLTLLRLVML